MRRLSVSAYVSRATAALIAASLAGTSLVPLAQAQEASKDAKPAEASSEATKPATPAKPPDAKTRREAHQAFGKGEKAFKKGEFVGAYDYFKAANDLIPSPQAEYWMALSLDKQLGEESTLDQQRAVLVAYELFLKNPKADSLGEEKLAGAEGRAEELRESVTAASPATVLLLSNANTALSSISVNGTTAVQCDESRSVMPCVEYVPQEDKQGQEEPVEGAVFFDAKGQPVDPKAPVSLWVEAGTYKLNLNAAGYQAQEMEVTVEGGQKLEQPVTMEPEPPPPAPAPPPEPAPVTPPPAPPPPPEERSMVPAYVTLGIAGASAALGTVFGVKALQAKKDFDDAPTTSKADDVERNALIADMAFGVAVTLGITGIVLLTTSDEPAEAQEAKLDKSRWQVAPYVSPKGGGAAARFSF